MGGRPCLVVRVSDRGRFIGEKENSAGYQSQRQEWRDAVASARERDTMNAA